MSIIMMLKRIAKRDMFVRAGEMAQWLRLIAALLEDSDSVPITQVPTAPALGDPMLSSPFSWHLHSHIHTHAHK